MGRKKIEVDTEGRWGQDLETFLRSQYVDQCQSTTQIAAMLGVSHQWVKGRLDQYQIPRRTFIEGRASWWETTGYTSPKVAENIRRVNVEFREKAIEKRAEYYRNHPRTHEQFAIDHLRARNIAFDFQVVFGPYVVDFVLIDQPLVLEITSKACQRNMGVDHQIRREQFIKERGYEVRYVIHYSKTSAHHLGHLIDLAIEGKSYQPPIFPERNHGMAG